MLAACRLVRVADVARAATFTDATCAEGLAIRRKDQRAVPVGRMVASQVPVLASEEAAMAREGPDSTRLGR